MPIDLNIITLAKGIERYVFCYSDEHRGECLRQIGRFASNPDLSLSWQDAAVLSQRINRDTQEVVPSGAVSPERAAYERGGI